MFLKRAGGIIIIFLLIWVVISLSRQEQNQKTILVAKKKLSVELATTQAQREKGLSDRKTLCGDCGLLFIFDKPNIYPFWMRRMYFDIDILWILGEEIVDITVNAQKPTLENFELPKERYQSKTPIDKVLEVNSGWVGKNGVKIGDKIKN